MYDLARVIKIKSKGGLQMKKAEKNNKFANATVKVLDKVLRTEINTTSCVVFYQPKAPKKLEKFKK